MTMICRSRTNAIDCPSGDQVGSASLAFPGGDSLTVVDLATLIVKSALKPSPN
jgi:hypothetical protein